MLTHQEDGGEVEAKLSSEGYLVIHCPKCHMVWGSDCFMPCKGKEALMPLMETLLAGKMLKIEIPATRGAGKPAPSIATMKKGIQQRIMTSAQAAFPEAFK